MKVATTRSPSLGRIGGACLAALLGVLLVATPVRGQEIECGPGMPEVLKVEYAGNRARSDRELGAAIETAPSSALRRLTRLLGTRHCLAPGALQRDVARLMLLYRRSGFPRVTVDTLVTPRRRDGVRVRFIIAEGPPMRLGAVTVEGITDAPLRRGLESELEVRAGAPLDQFAVARTSAALARRMQAEGFLAARVTPRTVADSTALRASATYTVEPGPRVRLGDVRVDARAQSGKEPIVSGAEVRRISGLRDGEVLRVGRLEEARKNLLDAQLFTAVGVRVDSLRTAGDSATADVRVGTVEAYATGARLRGGYGTIDCVRLEATATRAAFLEPVGRLELNGRLSKVGVGDPLDFAPGLCSNTIRDDPYSQWLNYLASATYRHPALGGWRVARSLTVYTERRSEYLAYLRTTYIGLAASLSRDLGRRWTGTLPYDLSYGRTDAQPAVLCVSFSACLPEDREQASKTLPYGALGAVLARDRSDSPLDPTRGDVLRFELRAGPWWLGTARSQQFVGARADAAQYRRTGEHTVLAARVRGAAVSTIGGAELLPQQERLFAGGATTVRGFAQNELGPRVYLVDDVTPTVVGSDTVLRSSPSADDWQAIPTGGTASLVGNVEARFRPPVLGGSVQLVGFVDAGAVWVRGTSEDHLRFEGINVTPGVGLRAFTPIGPVRIDLGYDDSTPRRGPAYLDVPVGLESAPLYCVSPDNTLPVTGFGGVDAEGQPIPPVQAAGPCPASFAPSRPGTFLGRLTFVLSLGQAF